MSFIHNLIMSNLPARRKTTSLGWQNFNSVCCHHRGHKQDIRSRGNCLFVQDGTIAYNCYNCGFKTIFDTKTISKNFELLMHWLGISNDDINKCKLELLQNNIDGITQNNFVNKLNLLHDFKEISLPENSLPFESILEDTIIPQDFLNVMSYLGNRGNAILNGWDYYWCDNTKWNLNNRVIIPFYQKNKIVGWTARYAGVPPKDTPRYYNSELQSGYLFNCDILNNYNRKYVLVAEGPFDAIALSGIGTLGSELNKQQISWLNSIDSTIIIVPDRQRKNQGLIDAALENDWYVSFPDWEDNIKDAADASCRYGKLFTIRSTIAARSNSKLHIGIKRKMFR